MWFYIFCGTLLLYALQSIEGCGGGENKQLTKWNQSNDE